jgi:O-antigen ligase
MTTVTIPAALADRERLEHGAMAALIGFAIALQISIAAAGIMLALTILAWVALIVRNREQIEVPPIFAPLVAYAVLTLIAAAFAVNPEVSFFDSKQLVLFLIVPAVYRLARGGRAVTIASVIVSIGAVSAAFGIVQYGIFGYDNLGKRPQGALTHYMTYSGLLVLVLCAAAARALFAQRDRRRTSQDRTWPALVMPALLVALALTFTRSAWVGASTALTLLLILKDIRLLVLLPVVFGVSFVLAPERVASRVNSMFDLKDPTSRDRVAMLRTGVSIISDDPLTGVGGDGVRLVYQDYRDPSAVERVTPHLHNVPLHIAAERGLPAVGVWIWFIVVLARDLWRKVRTSMYPALAAGGLAATASMLAAGLFEYNFGDSEFLMLFLLLITLPYAADREASTS